MNMLKSLPAMKVLCVLVTGQDVVTKDNVEAAFPLLLPFIQPQEIVAGSLQEANRLRAAVGKPPLGQPGAPGTPRPGVPGAPGHAPRGG
jgi:hypothetical protein